MAGQTETSSSALRLHWTVKTSPGKPVLKSGWKNCSFGGMSKREFALGASCPYHILPPPIGKARTLPLRITPLHANPPTARNVPGLWLTVTATARVGTVRQSLQKPSTASPTSSAKNKTKNEKVPTKIHHPLLPPLPPLGGWTHPDVLPSPEPGPTRCAPAMGCQPV